ncbi:hypothetical protein H5410_028145 [Solanum commersonii]|uniref:Uncharacterized protein n=1 Tax=Solanum commersonii TaxID=4109 RepID=A0A9J5Z378_SOLCO|nr:hypothetical protein H5410_028145 [Solanum commersonii]
MENYNGVSTPMCSNVPLRVADALGTSHVRMPSMEQPASLSQCDQLPELNDSLKSPNIEGPNSPHRSNSYIMQASSNSSSMQASSNNSSIQVGNNNTSSPSLSNVPGNDLFVELASLPCVAPFPELDPIEPIAPTSPDMQIENTHVILTGAKITIADLPVHGSFYDEVIRSAKELTHLIKGIIDKVPFCDWKKFWFRGPRKFEPSLKTSRTRKSQR